jgi:hypothetical protein
MKGGAGYTGELQNWVKNARLPPTKAMAKLLAEARSSMAF